MLQRAIEFDRWVMGVTAIDNKDGWLAQVVGLLNGSDVFEPRYSMDFTWEHYHRLNIILLSAIGLWPHGNTFVLGLQRFFGTFFALVCLVGNVATFITLNYTSSLLLENAPCIFVGFVMFVKYMTCLAAGDRIKEITDNINEDWKDLSCKEEVRIIEKYAERSKFHTKGFALFICPVAVCVVLTPLYSVFLDIVVPLDESRNRSFPIMFEVFFDQQKYFLAAVFLFDGVIIVTGLTFVSTETLLIAYVHHACALFEVSSRRINKLLYASRAKHSSRTNNLTVIAHAVEMDSRAIRQCKTIKEKFLQPYLILLGFAVMSLSTFLYRCTGAFAAHELTEFFTPGMFSVVILGYILYVNFVLQGIPDLSTDVFDDLYDSQWYEFPTSTKKLILFFMLNTIKPVRVDFSGIFVPSYKGFAVILKMVVSYVTALCSLK